MTTPNDLEVLLTITQAKYDQQQLSFQKLVAEENRLREELAKLDRAARDARAEPGGTTEMRAIGADIIWQGWVARSKTQLNLKLAQVLALKLHHLEQVKQAYGKVLVVHELLARTTKDIGHKAADAALARAIDYTLF